MPPGPRDLFGTIAEIFQTQLRCIALTFVVSQVRCIHSRDMSYHTQLLSIFIFILLYGGHIIFWLADSVSPPVLETQNPSSCYGSSSEPKGEYSVVFVAEELLYGYLYVH